LEFRDLVFVKIFGDKSLSSIWVSEVYDDLGSGDNVQYRLNQQKFRLEKLRVKFCNKSKATNEKSSFAETLPRVNDNKTKDIENSYLGDYIHEDLTEKGSKKWKFDCESWQLASKSQIKDSRITFSQLKIWWLGPTYFWKTYLIPSLR